MTKPQPTDPQPTAPRFTPRVLNSLAVLYLLIVTLISYGSALAPSNTFLPADLLLLRAPYKQMTADLAPGFHGVARPATDPLFQFYPARKYLRDSLRADYVPLWNPLSLSGTPFAADDQSAVFYPVNWLFAILPLASAFGWVAALHTFLTGLFFWLWGRRLGWGHSAALSGATAWMLCGVMVSWQMWQVVDSTLCWLPLALYFWEGYRASGSRRQAVGVAAALGLSLLAGHLQFGFFVWLTVFAYALYRPAIGTNTLRNLARAVGVFALATGLSFVQLAATADMLLRAARRDVSLSELLQTALPIKQIGLLFTPDLFGGQRDDFLSLHFGGVRYDFGSISLTGHAPFVGAVNLYELTVYCGVAAFVLACFGLNLRQRGDLSRFWVGVGLFALLMGLGTPLYALFYNFVPLFKSFHGVARVMVLFDFAIAALCGAGVQRLATMAPEERKRFLLIAGSVSVFAILIAFRLASTLQTPQGDVGYLLTHDWMLNGHVARFVGIPLLIAALTLVFAAKPKLHRFAFVVVAADMLLFAVGFNGGVSAKLLYPSTPATEYVSQNLGNGRVLCLADDTGNYQSRLMPNSAMSLGWRDVSGNDPLILASYDKYMRSVNLALAGSEYPDGMGLIPHVGPQLDQTGLKFVVSPSQLSLPGYREVFAGDLFVYERVGYADENRLLSIGGKAEASKIEITDSFGTETIKTAGVAGVPMLRTMAVNEPGWRLTVDGVLAQVEPDSALFANVRLTSGPHTVILRYLPAPVLFGLYITLLSIAIATGLFFSGLRRSESAFNSTAD
ncbi:MAG TPA: hypothetical protein VGK19_01235 [Capsulimonadaceae bacterium]